MYVSVSKSPDRRFTPYIKRAAQFYGEILIPNERIRNNIEIHITFLETLDNYGYAEIEGSNNSKKPRHFKVEIHPGLGGKEILKTIAHELVHIKQYAFGELNDNLSCWRGKTVDSDSLDYWWHPWEVEAYGLEVGLFQKFVIKYKLWEVFEDINNPDDPVISSSILWKNKD